MSWVASDRLRRPRRVLWVIVGSGALLTSASPAAAAVTFAAPVAHAVGDTPYGLAIADLNGDSDPEVVTANLGSDNVSVLVGRAAANFNPAVDYAAGDEPLGLAVADFNEDADPDVAVAIAQPGFHGGSVVVLPGRMNATLGPPAPFPTGGAGPVRSVTTGDFDRDGHTDLALVHDGERGVFVRRGDGKGGFGLPSVASIPRYPQDLVTADFNGDGDLDLATIAGRGQQQIQVLTGGPGLSFSLSASYRVSGIPAHLAVGDLTGDNDPDLAVTMPDGHGVIVLRGTLGAGFSALPRIDVGPGPRPIALRDLDGDGHVDIAVGHTAPYDLRAVSVLLGTGGGSFGPATRFPLGSHTEALAAGDVDGDGSLDLVTTSTFESDAVEVLLNTAALLSRRSIDFAPRADHLESQRTTITLTNIKPADLTITSAAVAGPDAADFPASSDTCTGATLHLNEACSIQVRFRPLETGPKTAAIRFVDSAAGSPRTVSLTGTGTSGGWLSLSAQRLAFGRQQVGTTSTPQHVTVTNAGSAAVQVQGLAIAGADPADYTGPAGTCTTVATLDAGASCTAQVAFRPTAIGTRVADLMISDDAPRNPHRVQLTGTGAN